MYEGPVELLKDWGGDVISESRRAAAFRSVLWFNTWNIFLYSLQF